MNISHLSNHLTIGKTGEVENAPGMIVDGIEALNVFSYITNEDHNGLLQYLRFQKTSIDLTTMKDSRDFSVLTYAAYRNNTNCFKILFEYAWKKVFRNNTEVTEENTAKF